MLPENQINPTGEKQMFISRDEFEDTVYLCGIDNVYRLASNGSVPTVKWLESTILSQTMIDRCEMVGILENPRADDDMMDRMIALKARADMNTVGSPSFASVAVVPPPSSGV